MFELLVYLFEHWNLFLMLCHLLLHQHLFGTVIIILCLKNFNIAFSSPERILHLLTLLLYSFTLLLMKLYLIFQLKNSLRMEISLLLDTFGLLLIRLVKFLQHGLAVYVLYFFNFLLQHMCIELHIKIIKFLQ